MSGIRLPFRGVWPEVAPDAFIAPNATLIGDVTVGSGASLWFGVVARGDVNVIRISAGTNIQDGAVIHCNDGGQGAHIGADVTVGHMALLHECTLEDGSFIGMQACVMDRAVVETGAMVAAGALVTPDKIVRRGELWAGRPARKMRDLRPDEIADFARRAQHYVALGAAYREQAAASARP